MKWLWTEVVRKPGRWSRVEDVIFYHWWDMKQEGGGKRTGMSLLIRMMRKVQTESLQRSQLLWKSKAGSFSAWGKASIHNSNGLSHYTNCLTCLSAVEINIAIWPLCYWLKILAAETVQGEMDHVKMNMMSHWPTEMIDGNEAWWFWENCTSVYWEVWLYAYSQPNEQNQHSCAVKKITLFFGTWFKLFSLSKD